MYFAASTEMTDEIVKNIRNYFSDVQYYSDVFNKDYSILSEPHKYGSNGEKYYLVSGKFPDRFRLYPHILVACTVSDMHQLDLNNIALQMDYINRYGRRDIKSFIKAGDLTISVNLTIRSMDQRQTSEITDLLCLWSTTYGREYFKKRHWFMNPMRGANLSVENLRDSSDSVRLYKGTISTSMRGQWLKELSVPGVELEVLTVGVSTLDNQHQYNPVRKNSFTSTLSITDSVAHTVV